jgi:Uma2 family endonuclease
MSIEASSTHRVLEPGTSGWTASHLDDPRIAAQWDAGRFEIINGVLKTMPPADFHHGEVVFELLTMTRAYFRTRGVQARVSVEVDLIIDEDDVLRVDGMLVTEPEVAEQKRVLVQLSRDEKHLGRIRVAPKLVIESISPGHERHDRLTKRRLYAGFGIPNYWLVDALKRRLECLVLSGDDYVLDVAGADRDVIAPRAFPQCQIDCGSLWLD